MKRLKELAVVEILSNGGFIVECVPSAQGRAKIRVYDGEANYGLSAGKQAYLGHTCHGHITAHSLKNA